LASLQVDTKLTNDLKALQDQVTLLQKQADTFTQFLLAFDMNNIDNFAKKNAPLNTFTGQLEAEGMVAGAFSVKVVDESAATIGKSSICQSAKALKNGTCMLYGSSDAQMMPANGRSVTIKTTSVTANSKIFVTPKLAITQPLAVTNIIPGVSFNVEVKDVILEDVGFDWFIVEEK
ncbi:MAG: hypothetical protein WCO05_01985, partial [Candidatus Moraniibacteriota bacterium]